MRVLHVAETAKGGVGTYLDELMPFQIEKLGSANVMALVPSEHRAQLPSVSDDRLLLFRRRDRSLASLLDLYRQLRTALREFRPEIVHLHSTFAGVVGRLGIGGTRRAKVIYTPHGWPFEMWPRGMKKRVAAVAERLLAKRGGRIVAVSDAERRQGLAVGIPPDKIDVVLSGISAQRPCTAAAEWHDERLKVLFVGRLDRQKGIDTLARIVSRHPADIALRVVGDSVVSKSTEIGTTANVQHLGWLERTAVDAQLEACDVLAMPSRWEALGIAALEAARVGKPTIAFSVGGLPEVIEDGVTGRVIPSDDEAAFERALLSESLERWRDMGAAAQRRFQKLFTSERMADQLLQLYLET